MKRLRVARPDDPVMQAWNRLADPLHQREFQTSLETSELVRLRGALLPKLISGELRIKDAERFMEATA
jgi:type I restriction enzyme S subunit